MFFRNDRNGKPVGKVNDSALRRVKKEDPVSMVEVFYSLKIMISKHPESAMRKCQAFRASLKTWSSLVAQITKIKLIVSRNLHS